MQKLFRTVRISLLYAAAVLVAGGTPLTTMADTAPAATTTPATTQSQSTTPSSTTPSSTSSTPTKPTYTYNTKTGMWDGTDWQYNPTSGTYEAAPKPKPPVVIDPTTQTTQPSTSTTAPTTGTGSTTQTGTSTAAGDTNNSTTTNTASNGVNANSKSGDATVTQNGTAGNATSGDATTQATILNNVNSTISTGDNQKAATFVSNVMGDVHGDILLQPMLLKSMLEAGTSNPSPSSTTVTNTSQLTNDVNLGATSGNANVTENTSAGSATTGSANTVANVMNIINSMVSAKQSFVGTINIYGSLDGDILVAPDFIPQLLASNGGSSQASGSAPTAVSAKDTQSILNNVSLAAQTGKAAVTGNTSAGNATTGDANTNVVLFNLSGHAIVASNSLLVFVNVLGKWVGVIVDAPAGATAAAIGNGVTSNTLQPDLVIDANANSQVTNNINLNSQSGDATVANNTSAGNATSGNATASANIGNVVNTSMGLSGWFGILFINVFGNWNGSFGVDTAAGNHRAGTTSLGPVPPRQNSGTQPMRVIDFIPRNSATSQYFQNAAMTIVNRDDNSGAGYTVLGNGTTNNQPQGTLTSASTTLGGGDTTGGSPSQSNDTKLGYQIPWLGGLTFLAGLSLVGASKLSDIRKSKR